MKGSLLILAGILLSFAASGQIAFTITANSDTLELYPPDTLRLCQNEEVTLQAHVDTVIKGTDTIPPRLLVFDWFFGDDSQDNSEAGIGLDSITYSYGAGGGYYLRFQVQTNSQTAAFDSIAKAVIPVQVALSPDFSDTEILPDHPVCQGDTISLRGNADSSKWTYEPVLSFEEENPQIIDNGISYDFRFVELESFAAYDTLENTDSLQSVCVTLEHSDAQDLYIELIPPDGRAITLKDSTQSDVFMGEPVDKEGVNIPGVGYQYCWAVEPGYGTMQQEAGTHTYTYTGANDSTYNDKQYLPGDSAYTPYESFDSLVGTPLNGKWVIHVVDTAADNNGFVFSWQLNFKDTFFTPKFEFSNTYESGLWSGEGANATDAQGNTFAKPPELGNTAYTYKVKSTEWECSFSETRFGEVTQATFTAEPEEGTADPELNVNFESTTEWAEKWAWNFGDAEASSEENPTYIYTEKGEYPVYLVAESAQGNTSRSDTTVIIVTVPEAKLELPNVFTPNNDGKNDAFVPKDIQALKKVEGKILNRWGRVVCEFNSSEEMEEGWDGTLHNRGNAEASAGVYYYVIIAKGKNNENLKRKGMLHLLR